MGATDSKLQFKTHIFRLFESPDIPVNDSYYWLKFWTQPESVYDIFTLLTANDIRKTRDGNLENLETLISVIYNRIHEIRNHKSFPNTELAPAKELLNCIRILTRLLPFIYESDNERIQIWEERFFWDSSQQQQSLGQELIDTGLSLLFLEGFTVPLRSSKPGSTDGGDISSSSMQIWETGVGSNIPCNATHEVQSNRVEVLRFLLTLVSDCLYKTSNSVALNGSKYLTYLVTKSDKRLTMAILCSLLNISLKYSPGGKVPYDHMLMADRNQQLVIYSLQFLTVLLVYPVPESDNMTTTKPPINLYRYFFSKIRHEQDFQFIIDNLLRLISQPIIASASLLPGSHSEIRWITELIMLFWELVQCNRKFREFLLLPSPSSSSTSSSSPSAHIDFMLLFLAYIQEKYSDASKRELVRLCAYVLLYLSSDVSFAKSLQQRVEGQQRVTEGATSGSGGSAGIGSGIGTGSTSGGFKYLLPIKSSKLAMFNGTYADYLIIQLLQPVIISCNNNTLDFLAPTLLEIIYNISPYITNVSYTAASNFIQVFLTLVTPIESLSSTTDIIMSKKFILTSILKSLSNMIHYNFRSNRNLLFVMLKNKNKFTVLQEVINGKSAVSESDRIIPNDDIESDETTIRNPVDRSETAKGKQPANISLSSPVRPQTPIQRFRHFEDMWALLDPIMMILDYLQKSIPYSLYFVNSVPESQLPPETKLQPHIVIDSIGNINELPGVDLEPNEPNQNGGLFSFEPVKFTWNASSLGWYESILWGSIFQCERQQLVSQSINEVATSFVMTKVGSVGVWNGTNIKLFKLQETARQGPSLFRPKGAVDAVAESMIEQFGKLTTSVNSNLHHS